MAHVSPRPQRTSTPQAVRFETKAIDLAGGWRGRVATVFPDRPCGEGVLTRSAWRSILEAFVRDPLAMDGAVTLKYSAGSEVVRGTFVCGSHRLGVVAKHHTPSGLSGRLSATLGGSRARRNFNRAAALLATRVPTATPLVWIERHRSQCESWWITSYIPGLVDLDHVALALLPQVASRERHRVKSDLIAAVAEMFVTLSRGGWHHRDLKASNLLLEHWHAPDRPLRAWLIDLDGLCHGHAPHRRHERQRLVRLAASLLSYASITRTDYARFLKMYRTARGIPVAYRDEFRSLAQAAGRYATRSARRKSHKLEGYEGE